jgi:ubiquinone biosynthesis protein
MSFKKKVESVERVSELVLILFEEGLDFLIYELELHTFVPFFYRIKSTLKKKAEKDFEVSVLNSLRRMGGLFVKAGEILSTKPDLVSKDFAKILEKLQDEDIPFKGAEKIVEAELKKDLGKIFSYFDPNPVSAASLGQVHKAKLKNGRLVAVKVQRPNIREQIDVDLKILKWLFRRIKKKKHSLSEYDLNQVFNEIKRYTLKELDYTDEAKNLKLFEKFFRDSKNIIIPKPYEDLTTKKVLVMSWEEGRKLKEFYNTQIGKKLQRYCVEAMVSQYFDLGVFQGDPHSGNFLVSKNNKLIFIDFGMLGSFDRKTRRLALKIILDFSNRDAQELTEDLIRLNVGKAKIDRKKFFTQNLHLLETEEDNKLLYDFFINALDNGIKLPPNFILFGKSVSTVQNVALSLNPRFDLKKDVTPFISNVIRESSDLKTLLKINLDEKERVLEKNTINFLRRSKMFLERWISKL